MKRIHNDTTDLDPRLCPCHAEPVRTEHRQDRDGNYRPSDICSVDGFSLGYQAGIPRSWWTPPMLQRIRDRRRIA